MLLKNTDDELTSLFGSETVTMAMGLLTAVMGGASQVMYLYLGIFLYN